MCIRDRHEGSLEITLTVPLNRWEIDISLQILFQISILFFIFKYSFLIEKKTVKVIIIENFSKKSYSPENLYSENPIKCIQTSILNHIVFAKHTILDIFILFLL